MVRMMLCLIVLISLAAPMVHAKTKTSVCNKIVTAFIDVLYEADIEQEKTDSTLLAKYSKLVSHRCVTNTLVVITVKTYMKSLQLNSMGILQVCESLTPITFLVESTKTGRRVVQQSVGDPFINCKRYYGHQE